MPVVQLDSKLSGEAIENKCQAKIPASTNQVSRLLCLQDNYEMH